MPLAAKRALYFLQRMCALVLIFNKIFQQDWLNENLGYEFLWVVEAQVLLIFLL
jgi:hypothetical protein